MTNIFDRLFAPGVGVVTSFFTWEAFSSFAITLLIALVGGFLAQLGKELAMDLRRKRKAKKEEAK